jgi:hypothetical protein
MNKRDRAWILKEAKKAFFEALLAGYAGDGSGVKKEKTPDGYNTLVWEKGPFRVVDRYCVTKTSNKSAGTTTIFFECQPIWWMSYGGWYEEKAIPTLRKALAEAYRLRRFIGGRGVTHTHGFASKNDGRMYKYTNHPDKKRRFFHGQFEGVEYIWQHVKGRGYFRQPKLVGCHRYFGTALI